MMIGVLATCIGLTMAGGQDVPTVRIGESGEFLDWESGGQTIKNYLALHRVVGARYFSAGVGVEERAAVYPPFPLKLVFTAGGKPFLSGVTVTIQPVKGGSALVIPREQVEGPWLFLDLAPGLYDVTAEHGNHSQQLKGLKVEVGKHKVVYLRWTEDYGLAGRHPAE
jgi:hypothetical protein